MKFTLSWLKQHLETTATLTEICDKLTAIGLEVEGVENNADALKPFVIAEIISAEKHPDADRLRVCQVNSGSGMLQIVCGAPNARAGLKTVLARVGDVIPKTGEALKKGVIRGIESQGMMCSAAELGIDEESSGIMELPTDAPVGANYATYAGLDDPQIEINLTPNRGDAAGVHGIARDLDAAGLGTLKPQNITAHKSARASSINVTLDFPEASKSKCPLFIGRVIRNVKNNASPAWLKQRLHSIGSRPISALVDITNFLTFDSNRPFHVFDASKIKGHLRVFEAKGGESFEALNGKTYILEAGMTVIGDDNGILSLAGVMGGASSACEADTVDVFIESALFCPTQTAHTGRALQINSDARYRFERGLDPAFTQAGAELATSLVLELCGTPDTTIEDLVIAGSEPDTTRRIAYQPSLCLKRLGIDVAEAEQIEILTKLGFKIEKAATHLNIIPPSWRGDVVESADITEEVIRIKGFEHIPAISMPRFDVITKTGIDALDRNASKTRRALAARGLNEAVTWSFMPSALAAQFGEVNDGLRLINPISADLDVMRPSILGNLVQAAKRNADKGYADVALFEVGPVYKKQGIDGQKLVATTLRAGCTPRHWAEAARKVDAFDAKADALAALAAAGAPAASLQVSTDAPSWYHPGRSGCLRLGATVLATFGELHPSLLKAADAEGPMVASEIFLENISEPRSTSTARPLLKLNELQPVSRDFAFLVDANTEVAKLVKAIRGVDKTLITDANVFDVYEGDKIQEGKKSIAISVTLQPTQQSLTEEALDDLSKRVAAAALKATGATLRA